MVEQGCLIALLLVYLVGGIFAYDWRQFETDADVELYLGLVAVVSLLTVFFTFWMALLVTVLALVPILVIGWLVPLLLLSIKATVTQLLGFLLGFGLWAYKHRHRNKGENLGVEDLAVNSILRSVFPKGLEVE